VNSVCSIKPDEAFALENYTKEGKKEKRERGGQMVKEEQTDKMGREIK